MLKIWISEHLLQRALRYPWPNYPDVCFKCGTYEDFNFIYIFCASILPAEGVRLDY